jgi:tRNA pseudouridine55 synthase
VNANHLNGVLLINKPSSMTSHRVVDNIRRILEIEKVGHTGTLDPMATGLLLILIGGATKISQDLIGLPKCYEGTMKLGVSTDSHDIDGEVTEIRNVGIITLDNIKSVASTFLGDQYQVPPMFSAKKIDGKKLYELARKGKEVERAPQPIRIDSFEIHGVRGDEVDFSISCSKGTYVRTLVNDFGQCLMCGAHLSRLRRTKIGNFSLSDASDLDEIWKLPIAEVAKRLIPMHEAVPPRTAGRACCD